jgi:hypothetical protein
MHLFSLQLAVPQRVCTPGANYGIGHRLQPATLNCRFLYRPEARPAATALLQPVPPRRPRIAVEDAHVLEQLCCMKRFLRADRTAGCEYQHR